MAPPLSRARPPTPLAYWLQSEIDRAQPHLSISATASECNCATQTFFAILKGRNASIETIDKLAAYFHVSREELIHTGGTQVSYRGRPPSGVIATVHREVLLVSLAGLDPHDALTRAPHWVTHMFRELEKLGFTPLDFEVAATLFRAYARQMGVSDGLKAATA